MLFVYHIKQKLKKIGEKRLDDVFIGDGQKIKREKKPKTYTRKSYYF